MVNISSLKKLYYSIGEVAEMFDVNTSLIRFWEKEFPSIKPKKNKKGNRLFKPKDIAVLNNIYRLVKIEGHTLDGAKKALKHTGGNQPNPLSYTPYQKNKEIITQLESITERLLRLKS